MPRSAAPAPPGRLGARPLAVRIETLRRIANAVRGSKDALADHLARGPESRCGNPPTEVDAVVKKVDISVSAYSERTRSGGWKARSAPVAVRHKPHGVLAVLGPYNFPRTFPIGTIVPALLAGNAVCQADREDAREGRVPVPPFHRRGPRDVVALRPGRPRDGRRSLARHGGIDGCSSPARARRLSPHRQFARLRTRIHALEMGRQQPARRLWDAQTCPRRGDRGPVRLPQARASVHRRPPSDRQDGAPRGAVRDRRIADG
jgi:succinylglutamic semialdehyde dehydrogenase